MPFVRRSNDDLHVSPECGQKIHQTLDRKRSGPVAHEQRNMRLFDAQQFASFGLGDAALLDQLVDFERELGLQQFLLRVGQAEIGENIVAAPLNTHPLRRRFSYTSSLLSFHRVSFAFADASVRLRRAVD